MPGVAARTPSGLTYTQVIDLITGIGKKARIVGFDLVEFYPPADIDGISALNATRILVNVVGTVARQKGSALRPSDVSIRDGANQIDDALSQ